MAAIAGLIGVIVAFSSTIYFMKGSEFGWELNLPPIHEVEVVKLSQELLAKKLSALDYKLSAILAASTNGTPSADYAAIKTVLDDLSSRLAALEKSLLDNPEKALSVPLLRQDLENLKLSYRSDGAEYTRQIDRVYDQNKWFIGLMFSMALGLIGLAISNFLQIQKRKD